MPAWNCSSERQMPAKPRESRRKANFYGPPSGHGLMSNSDYSSPLPELGRIARRAKAADQTGWGRWLPGLRTLRAYQVAWLRHDIVAGLVLATMLVPVGIAYAVASGIPGIYGLYATIVPLF